MKKHSQKNEKKKSEKQKNKIVERKTIKEGPILESAKLEKRDEDKKERRDARTGIILTIIATLGTASVILFRGVRVVLTEWPLRGHAIYITLMYMFIIPLAIVLIIFWDIAKCILTDLKRYNVADEGYEQHDDNSDENYRLLLEDFQILLGIFLFVIVVYWGICAFYQGDCFSRVLTVFAIAFVLGISLMIAFKDKKWKEILNILKKVARRLPALLGVSFCILIIGLILVVDGKSRVEITYNIDGKIIMENESNSLGCLANMQIYGVNAGNELGMLFLEQNLDESEILYATEIKRNSLKNTDGKEIGSSQALSEEVVCWKYIYNMQELKLKDGKYCVIINIEKDNSTVRILNMFEVFESKFIFAKDLILKEY